MNFVDSFQTREKGEGLAERMRDALWAMNCIDVDTKRRRHEEQLID
jgi:hypothetical protein